MLAATDTLSHTIAIHPARIQAVANSSILVVDDDSVIRKILTRILSNAGFTNIHTAKNGAEAIQTVCTQSPDLILLDLVMPDMDGLAVCETINNMQLDHPPAILMQTGSRDGTHIVEAFSRGAVDYVTKPARDVEIIMRSLTHLERRNLALQLADERNRMRIELSEASQLQRALLPSQEIVHSIATPLQLDIASHVTFSSELGGDIWGMKDIGKHHLCLYTVDMTGHGLKAALHTFRVHSLIQDSAAARTTPSTMLSLLNNKLHGIMPTGQFATMCYMFLDTELRTLDYSTAAAPLPIIVRRNGEHVALEGSGLPLGCAANSNYKQQQVTLLSGDTILVYSDALLEVIPNLTEEDIVQLIRQHDGSAQDMLDNLMVEILHHLGNETISDDLTLVVIRFP